MAGLIGAVLTISASPTFAGVEYDDTNLHRSDEMVRFDRAYRAGLDDGTTTIIYSESKAPGALPDQPASSNRMKDHRTEGQHLAERQSAPKRRADSSTSISPAYEYDDSIPEKLQDESLAEKRKYPTRSGSYNYDGTRRNDCDCADDKRMAPRSEPIARSERAQHFEESTMREKLDAVRKARELLRNSRTNGSVHDEVVADKEPKGKGRYGSETPRLIEHSVEVTEDSAPLGPYEIDPDYVRNQEVSVEIGAATIEEIATELMPRGWRVRLSTADQEIHESRYEFVSSDPREVALRKLLIGTGLGYKMFFKLKDEHGNPSPLLVISEVNS